MRSGLPFVLAMSLLVGLATQAHPQDEMAPVENAEADGFASVIGIAHGDLLNIRAAASPIGLVIARVPNGSLLKVEECTTASGNLWCKVEEPTDEATNGWTPARYLSGYEDRAMEAAAADSNSSAPADTTTIMSEDTVLGPEIVNAEPDPRSRGMVAAFYTMPLPKSAPAGKSLFADGDDPRHRGISGGAEIAALIALPVVPGEGNDLVPMPVPQEVAEEIVPRDEIATAVAQEVTSEEGGDLQSADTEFEAPLVSPAETAPADLKGAKQERPTPAASSVAGNDAGKVGKPVAVRIAPDPATEASREAAAGQVDDTVKSGPEADSPQSRLQEMASTLRNFFGSDDEAQAAETPIETAAAAVPEIVAAPSPDSSETVTGAVERAGVSGQIPCARYLGQPMAACEASVMREGVLAAVVTVKWPDGGTRIIRFREGRVEGSDSSLPFRAVREADLNMIRIGRSERFEITDAFAFGG